MQRVRKQATYAIGCFGLLFVVAVMLVLRLGEARLPATPAPKASPTGTYQAIVVEGVDVVRHAGTVDIVARLRNPNSQAGVDEYPVTFVLANGAGQEISRHTETSYLLPGSRQYVVAIGVAVAEPVARVALELPPSPSFTDLPVGLTLPRVPHFLRGGVTLQVIGEATFEEQKGVVRNDSTFNFQRVQLVALAQDAAGAVVGVATTFVGELKVGEQREFIVQWPQPPRPTATVVVLASTNIFAEENIIRTRGEQEQ